MCYLAINPSTDIERNSRSRKATSIERIYHRSLRGPEAAIGPCRKILNRDVARFRKVYPQKSSTYFIEHASLTYLLDQDGRYVAFLPPGTTGERMAVLVRERL